MPALDSVLQEKLNKISEKGLRRSLAEIYREAPPYVTMGDRRYISFSCNDYLGLSHHPQVVDATIQAAREYGAGAGASRLVTGNHPLYRALESGLAQYKKTEAALVFGSGYLANVGVIPALVAEGDLVIADKLVHACILDGISLSGAKLLRFRHNDIEHCEMLLKQHRDAYRHCLIITETVFSMDGDLAPMDALSSLAQATDSWLMTDDAHGMGVVAPGHASAMIQMGTFSKAIGTYGGYVCGSQILVDYVLNQSRSMVFTTGLPAPVVAASLASLKLLAEDNTHSQKLMNNVALFCKLAGISPSPSAIIPVVLGEAERAVSASLELMDKGFYVKAIRPPTVPDGTARLRIAMNSRHEEPHIHGLVAALKETGCIV